MADPELVTETAAILTPDTPPVANTDNPVLPPEILRFGEESVGQYSQLNGDEWLGAMHATEIDDKQQQIRLRPVFAVGVFTLLMVQNVGIWFLVTWALQRGELPELQLILSTLIGGTLTQSYFILRFITNKVFSDIDYHNGSSNPQAS